MFYNKRIILFICLMTTALMISAQEEMAPLKDFCQPGVEHKSPGKGAMIEYGYFPGYGQRSSNEETTKVHGNHHLLAKFRIPIINKERFKFLVGMRYFEEIYVMDDPDQHESWLFHNLDAKKLKSHRFSAYLSRSFGCQHYLGLKAELSYNGDYNSFLDIGSRYQESFIVGIIGRKPTPYKEWGLGLITRFGYRGMATFPFLIYNQTFNEHWGIEATLPVKFMIRYRMNEVSLLLFGGEFASRNYSVDLHKGTNDSPIGRYTIINPEGQLNIAYQQKLRKWVWLEMKSGYVRYLKANIDGKHTVSDIDFSVHKRGSGFFKVGLFLSPPKSFLKKGT